MSIIMNTCMYIRGSSTRESDPGQNYEFSLLTLREDFEIHAKR